MPRAGSGSKGRKRAWPAWPQDCEWAEMFDDVKGFPIARGCIGIPVDVGRDLQTRIRRWRKLNGRSARQSHDSLNFADRGVSLWKTCSNGANSPLPAKCTSEGTLRKRRTPAWHFFSLWLDPRPGDGRERYTFVSLELLEEKLTISEIRIYRVCA